MSRLSAIGLAAVLATSSCSLFSPTTAPSVVEVSVDAASRGAAVNPDLVGVNGPGPAGAVTAMAAIGVAWVRVGVGLASSYDCTTGVWDPTNLDNQIAQVRAEGGIPEVDLGGTPSCLVTNPPPGQSVNNDPPDVGSQNQAAWDKLVYQAGYHEIASEGVTVFEVENEPDWVFWNGTMQQYFQTYNDTATSLEKAAKAAGIAILVGGPTLANVLDTMDTGWLDPFLAYVSANGLPLDFLSWHIYPNDPLAGPSPGLGPVCLGQPPGPSGNPCYYNQGLAPSLYASEATQAREALAAYPALHPLLVIDEWNLDGEYDARQNGPFDAVFAAAALSAAQAAGVDRMCFWDTADNANDTLGNWGMLNPDLSPKPVYWTFDFFHQLAGDTLPMSFQPSQVLSSEIGAVGGTSAISTSGAVDVLLYNFQPYDYSGSYGISDPTPTDHNVLLEVRGLTPGTPYTWERRSVDADHSGQQVASGSVTGAYGASEVMFVLPGDSVSLVTFTPQS